MTRFAEETSRQSDDRRRHVAAAERWTTEQARRLGVSHDAVLAAVGRGWLPDRIEAVEDAGLLIGAPRRL